MRRLELYELVSLREAKKIGHSLPQKGTEFSLPRRSPVLLDRSIFRVDFMLCVDVFLDSVVQRCVSITFLAGALSSPIFKQSALEIL